MAAEGERVEQGETLAPWIANNYGHAFWPNGWRKQETDKSPDILCFETGRFGLTLDMNDLTKASFGKFDETDEISYTDALDMEKRSRMEGLVEERLLIEVQVDGETYHAVTCLAGTCNSRSKAKLWETGRFVQHYQLIGLVFEDVGGSQLECQGNLHVLVWPQSFSLTLVLSPNEGTTWAEGANIRIELGEWSAYKAFIGAWDSKMQRGVSLDCNVIDGSGEMEGISFEMSGYQLPNIQVKYDDQYSCYVAEVCNPPRTFQAGYTDIREYDKFNVFVRNDTEEGAYVPFLLQLKGPAQITGVVPMVCRHTDGTPTGIPIQLSKNWHNKSMGNYVRAYSLLPVPPNSTQRYVVQFIYGFYGSLPSASHANLSLVGWNDTANGRWEQLAIGCWGETFCLDVEFSATGHNAITDVRALMLRRGPDGPRWRWTNGGWGGDWLDALDSENRRVSLRGMKAAYISQGPCLTEVRYGGYYGAVGGSNTATFLNTVRTLRTDDYARTFHTLNFTFHGDASFQNAPNGQGSCLFRVGGCGWEGLTVRVIVVGNSEGLTEGYHIPADLGPNTFFKERITLTGTGPWLVGYPAMNLTKETKGHGSRGLIIQSYEVITGGEKYVNPCISFFVREGGAAPNVDTFVTLPEGIDQLRDGDSVSVGLYWAILPHNADDYYGPNEALRKHLQEFPGHWKTVLREAQGNNLKVEVTGGEIKNTYPLVIKSSGDANICINVIGGVGAVPMRFEGLDSASYRLFGANTEGDDCNVSPVDNSWQTDYDSESFTYSVTYNVLLDGLESSAWVLKKQGMP